MKRAALLIVLALGWLGARQAAAYPQFQLSKDQTCTSCHISPSGGGLLTENGTNVAEAISDYGTDGRFMYGSVPTPDWLSLGGDGRYQYGYLKAPQQYLVGFPMQLDLYANAALGHFRVQVTAGFRPTEYGNEAATHVWSREHYVMYETDPDGHEGWYFRVGRFMPVFGLRWVDHTTYTRQFGGVPLYGETYGAAAEYVSDKYEAHVTGFIADPLIDAEVHNNGGAAYVEARVSKTAAIGLEGMVSHSDDGVSKDYRGGVTGKIYLDNPGVLLAAEVQVHNQRVEPQDFGLTQLIGYAMATWYGPKGTMVDLGVGHFDQDIALRADKRDCVDLDIHWFTTSHLELMLVNRIEVLTVGPTGAYSFLQIHYRL